MTSPRPKSDERKTDPELCLELEALRRGDRDAVARALHSLIPQIRGWLFRLLGTHSDLDDATQDALIAVAKALPRFRGRAKLSTFAHRITVRIAYRYFRQERPEHLHVVAPAIDNVDPESITIHREALRRLHSCLRNLPPKRRVAFVLCAVEGLEPKEAAKVARVPAVTMRARLLQARREVERRLGGDPYVRALLDGRDR